MKTEVYSWRVSPDLKSRLEREARRRNLSVSAILDLATREWLDECTPEMGGDEEQLRRRKAASKSIGALAGGNPHRSENVGQAVRQRLRQRYDH
jgi:hypothetical protein